MNNKQSYRTVFYKISTEDEDTVFFFNFLKLNLLKVFILQQRSLSRKAPVSGTISHNLCHQGELCGVQEFIVSEEK